MNKKEKATLGGISAEGSDGQQITLPGFEKLSGNDFIMQAEKNQPAIAGLLMTGAENAVSLLHLVRITGKESREIRKEIQRERLAGIPIVADCRSGYYLAATAAERDRCARSMFHRSDEIRRTAEASAAAEVEDG